ncbi:uncharacterized protein [Cherax quadricarinatus]
MAMWLAMVAMLVACGVAGVQVERLTATPVLLSSLNPRQLDMVLDSRLAMLKEEILNIYEEELRKHEGTIETVHRARRVPPPSPLPGDLWHSYTFNTGVGNREEVEIEGVESVGNLGPVDIDRVFPLNLPDIPAIYKSGNGLSYIEVNGTLVVLKIRNRWTSSSTGCECNEGTNSMECACCMPGGCLCRRSEGYTGDTCVACGFQSTTCQDSGRRVVVDAATGFTYSVRHGGWQRVVVIAQGSTITFYKVVDHELSEISSLSAGQTVTDLGYGVTFADHEGIIQKTMFLIVFSAAQTLQTFYKISVGAQSSAFAVGIPREWHAEGSVMKVMQSGGRVVITVHESPNLHIYELKEDFWMKFQIQKVQTLAATFNSWIMFSTGFESYIATVATDKITIFVQSGVQYEVMQVLSTSNGLQSFDGILAVHVKSCRGEVVLMTGFGKHLVGMVFDPQSSSPGFKVALKGSLSVDVTSWKNGFAYIDSSNNLAVVILPTSSGAEKFIVQAHLVEVKDPVELQTQGIIKAVDDIKDEYNRQKDIITAAENLLYYSVASHSDIHANITITRGVFVNKTLSTGELEATQLVFPGTVLAGGVSLQQYLVYLEHLGSPDAVLDGTLDEISYIESVLNDAVPASGIIGTIGGLKTIASDLDLRTLVAKSAIIDRGQDATGIDLMNTLSSLVKLNSVLTIRGRKTFTNKVIINTLYTEFLDNIPVNDIVTVGGKQTIAGSAFVNDLAAENIYMLDGGTVAGLNLSEAVLLNEPASLGHVSIESIAVEGNLEIMSGIIDGVDLNYLYKNALQLSGGELSGSLAFSSNILAIDRLEGTRMMGINVRDLASDIVYKDEDAVLFGKLIVSQSVVVEKNLYAGDINSKEFPEDYPLKTDNSLVFTDLKNFTNIVIDNVKFSSHGVIDGIAPDRFVTKTSDQEIIGVKIFAKGVNIEGDLLITSKVIDGVNLDKLFATKANGSMSGNWDFNVIFRKPVQMTGILYDGTLNGRNLSAVSADLVYTFEDPVIITGHKRFLSGLSVSHAELSGTFNEVDISSLVTTDTEEINGVITFQDIMFNELIVDIIDGVNIRQLLDSALFLDKPDQVIYGKKEFLGGITAGSLIVEGRVKGVDFKNVVTKSGSQTFIAPQTMYSAEFSSLYAHMIKMSDGFRVNGVDFSELASKRISLTEPVNVTAALSVLGPVTVIGTLSADYINGYNIKYLRDNLVTNNGDSIIEGPVTFESLAVEGSITTEGGVGANGLSLSAIAEAAAKLSGNNLFTGDLVFNSMVLQGDLGVEGLIDGVDLAVLQHNAVYTDSSDLQVITGLKVFEAGFTVKGDINTSLTNGVDLSTRLFTLHTDQVITAPYTFTDLGAETVHLQGFFNDMDLKRLAMGALMSEDILSTGSVTFTNGVEIKNLVIEKTLNDIDVKERLGDAVRLEESGLAITGTKTFTTNALLKNLHVDYLNDVYLDGFLARLVSRDAIHSLSSVVTVNGVVSAPWVNAEYLKIEGTIDGIDYQELKANVVYLSGEQEVKANLVFLSDLYVRGNIEAIMLNSYNLAEDYLTTNTEQTINVTTTCGNIQATYIDVEGTVNNYNLTREREITMLSVGGQVVLGTTTISGSVVVLSDLQCDGRVGSDVMVKLADQVVLLTEDVEISGGVKFTSILTTTSLSSSTSMINDVNLPDLYDNAWYVDTPLTISARFVFNSHTTMKASLVCMGPIDEFEVSKAYMESAAALAIYHNVTEEFKAKFEHVCEPIALLYKALENLAYEGDYFTHETDQNFNKERSSSISFNVRDKTYLILSYEGECISDMFLWDKTRHTFVHHQTINTGHAKHWLLLEMDKVYIAMAASSMNNTCHHQSSSVWLLSASSLELFQMLVAGEHLSRGMGPDGHLLHVHSQHNTITYTFLKDENSWKEVEESPLADQGEEVMGGDGSSVYWVHHGNKGQLYVNGVPQGESLELPRTTIDHASLYMRHTRVILFLLVTTRTYKEPLHTLRVYYIENGHLTCVATEDLSTSGRMSVFFAGNDASGALFIVISQHESCPRVFTFKGEVLKAWPEPGIPGASWIQHFQVTSETHPSIKDHYLLLGRSHANTSIYRLVMKGVAVPKRDLTCQF